MAYKIAEEQRKDERTNLAAVNNIDQSINQSIKILYRYIAGRERFSWNDYDDMQIDKREDQRKPGRCMRRAWCQPFSSPSSIRNLESVDPIL